MLHLRVTVPADRARAVHDHLRHTPGVAHLAHLPGASTHPPGDLVLCDLARESADGTVSWLLAQGLERDGAIAIDPIGTMVSDHAERAERMAPGYGSDALVWEELEARAREDAVATPSTLVLMAVAGMIAGVGILLDSPLLVVGAMIVGTEYGPIAAACVALVRRRWRASWRAICSVGASLGVAALATWVLAVALRATSIAPDGYEVTDRQLTAFISNPDALSTVVAVLAGVAGMLSLTEGRPSAMVGVLVSVTTVPAAANVGLAAAYGAGSEVRGAAVQLLLNVTGLLLAGVVTLLVQAHLTTRLPIPPADGS